MTYHKEESITMRLEHLSPEVLQPNPWNSNHVDFENMDRLRAYLLDEGWVKPILARKLDDGSYQIIGGQHRVEIAREEPSLCPIPTIVFENMDDDAAKRAGLVDNIRYGEDDEGELSKLLESIGGQDFSEAFLPVDLSEISLLATTVSEEEIDGMLSDSSEVETERAEKKPAKDVRVMRFKVSSEDAAKLDSMIERTKKEFGFTEADKLTNIGDAIVHLLLSGGDNEDA